jgi:hypothetical protein
MQLSGSRNDMRLKASRPEDQQGSQPTVLLEAGEPCEITSVLVIPCA